MNDAQTQALEKAQEILSEHFEHYVISIGVDVDELSENGKLQQHAEVVFGGGWIAAWGLILFAYQKAMANFDKEND